MLKLSLTEQEIYLVSMMVCLLWNKWIEENGTDLSLAHAPQSNHIICHTESNKGFPSGLSIVEMLGNKYGTNLVSIRKFEKIDYKYRKLQLGNLSLQPCHFKVFAIYVDKQKPLIVFGLKHLPKQTVTRRNQYEEEQAVFART